jgi:hypothetical protein
MGLFNNKEKEPEVIVSESKWKPGNSGFKTFHNVVAEPSPGASG